MGEVIIFRKALATFYDFGWSDDTDLKPPYPAWGLACEDPHRQIHGEIYLGIALPEVEADEECDLQDSGIHFALDIRLF